MLPGFRFLFAAIMLSMSVLVFGLGAAALLRAAHEEVASNPSWRAAPEMTFAQQPEATRPLLAMLHVDLPPAETAQDNAPAADGQAAITLTPNPSERIAALRAEDSSPPESTKAESAKAEIPVAENPATKETAAVQVPTSADETRVATIAADEVSPRENLPAPALSEPAGAQVAPPADIAEKIATLGGPPVSIETPRRAKVRDAKPDQSEVKKRQQARRAVQRRRLAARARVAAQAQAANPFGQPAPTTTVRTR
jgi:hypothetical protein